MYTPFQMWGIFFLNTKAFLKTETETETANFCETYKFYEIFQSFVKSKRFLKLSAAILFFLKLLKFTYWPTTWANSRKSAYQSCRLNSVIKKYLGAEIWKQMSLNTEAKTQKPRM